MAGRPLRRLRNLERLQNPMIDGKFVSRMALARASRTPRVMTDEERARSGDKNLRGASLVGAKLSSVDLSGADLEGANLTGASLSNANLSGANLTGASLFRARGTGTNFSGANLDDADLRESWFEVANFSDASLQRVHISTEDFSADFRGLGAGLPGSTFSRADLRRASLSAVDVRGADFREANLDKATMLDLLHDRTTLWPKGFRPGPSYGSPEEHYVIRTPASEAFRRWFSGSVVVDASGNPLPVYHGTNEGGFTVFSLDKVDPHQPGFYFTDSLPAASTYTQKPSGTLYDPLLSPAKDGVYRVYLRLLRPLVVEGRGAQWDMLPGVPGVPKRLTKTYEIAAYAKESGYDGVVFRDIKDVGESQRYFKGVEDVYVVFSPTQIKSATANRGTFDPDDSDIRHNPPRRSTARRAR